MISVQESKLSATINEEINKNEIQISSSKNLNISLSRRQKKRKRKSSNLIKDNEESYIDETLEEKLQECAKRNNLSSVEVKKILKSLIANDHVLALVKLQEEEALAKNKLEKEHKSDALQSLSPKGYELFKSKDLLDSNIPKLTRAKARALNKKLMPIPSLNEKAPEPEVAALISQELNSDEEDEEYCPKEEDFMSDDDQNTTISDIESQPATPLTPQHYLQDSNNSAKTSIHLTEDGIFKLPQKRSISTGSNSPSQHEEIIAKRTRSKLCLQTTPIETIESTFIPPDITTDMYDFDGELDQEWVSFLNEFTKPLNVTNSIEEDEDDPEYIAAEKVPIDAEELRDVNISKKELNDLITELFNGLANDDVFVENISTTSDVSKNTINENKILDKSPQRKKLKLTTDLEKSPLSSQTKKYLEEKQKRRQANLDLSLDVTFDRVFNNEENYSDISIQNHSHLNSNIISTPQSNFTHNKQYQPLTVFNKHNDFQPITNVATDNQTSLTIFSGIPTTVNTTPTNFNENLSTQENEVGGSNVKTYVTLPVSIPITSSIKQDLKYIAIPINLTSNLQIPRSNYRIISTIDLTKSPSPPPLLTSEFNKNDTGEQSTAINTKPDINQTYVTIRKTKKERKIKEKIRIFNDVKELYAKKYEKLKNIKLEEEKFDQNLIGFTDLQKKIFEQQMQMHVQFCTQNFIQTYSHPELWKLAKPQKNMLLELEKKCNRNTKSAFNAWNLKIAIKLIESWENELSECSEENRVLMDFFYSEIDRIKNTKGTKISIMRFPPRIMKLIVQSSVFMYPDLLPKIPFRFNINNLHQEFCPSEDHIIAHAMDYYFKEIKDNKPPRTRCSKLRIVCEKITKNLITWKSWKTVYNYIIFCRDKKTTYNPIKFYFERGRAPPFKHIVHEIDLECVLPPKRRISELPSVWKEFVETIELKKTCQQQSCLLKNNTKKLGHKSTNKNRIKKDIDSYKQVDVDDNISKASLTNVNENQDHLINSSDNQTLIFSDIVNKSNTVITKCSDSNLSDTSTSVNFNYTFDYENTINGNEKVNEILNNKKTNILNNSPITIHHIREQSQQRKGTKDSDSAGLLHYNNANNVSEVNNTNKFQQIITTIHNRIEPENFSPNFTKNSSILSQTNKQTESKYCNIKNNKQNELKKTISSPISQVPVVDRGQKLLTDYFKIKCSKNISNPKGHEEIHKNYSINSNKETNNRQYSVKNISDINCFKHRILQDEHKSRKISVISYDRRINGKRKKHLLLVKKYRNKIKLRRKIEILLNTYKKFINSIYTNYKNKYLQKIYTYFKTLELYTNLLDKLKMNCKKLKNYSNIINNNINENISNCNTLSSNACAGNTNIKRPKIIDDELKLKKSMKANENLKLMLMNENNEDINKKNAIYAANFYDKVEEVLKEKNQPETLRKFQNILKKFNPNKDRVADLYNKIESLFLPDHPDLVEVFLTFLLPSQAAEIGKFFEHFMLTNMTNFINKLNIYFSKQPSQVKKVYASLNKLSEDTNLTMDKIKSKILPLLKGNQFLIDWFLQIFPSEEPPQSLNIISENISAKQLETQIFDYTPEFVSQKDLIPDSTDNQSCQIRYINGRLFYGSRILLPAKLAFIAKNLKKNEEWNIGTGSNCNIDYEEDVLNDENVDDNDISIDDERLSGTSTNVCVHPISTYAEKIIKNHNQYERDNCTESEKSEDEDFRDNEIKYKICDDTMHKQHALRLNPFLYSSSNYIIQSKLKYDINERDVNKSPKKQYMRCSNLTIGSSSSSLLSNQSVSAPTQVENEFRAAGGAISSSIVNKDKRKSPTKKTYIKSPVSTKKYVSLTVDSNVSINNVSTEIKTTASETVIPTVANAMKTAKKLKAMVEENNLSENQIKQQKKVIKKNPSLQSSSILQKVETSADNISVSETDCNNCHNAIATLNINWTREEDKIILEEVKLGFDSEENLMKRLKSKLSNREVSKITQRYQFLMDVLSQLQNRT